MLSRLVVPLAFLIGLATLFFVMQSLGGSTPSTATNTDGPDSLKQFEVKPIAPINAAVTDSKNQKVELPTLFTRPTLLTFWSSNCGECDKGLPALDQFSKSQSKIAVVIIDSRDNPDDAQAKLKTLDVSLETYYDSDGSAFQSWEATMPSSYYVTDSQIKYFFPGRISAELLQALLTSQP